jgi:hypothetical protein
MQIESSAAYNILGLNAALFFTKMRFVPIAIGTMLTETSGASCNNGSLHIQQAQCCMMGF